MSEWREIDLRGRSVLVSRSGEIKYADSKKIIPQNKNCWGYSIVNVYSKKTKKIGTFLVHRIVARSFLGESKLGVDHIDFNKTNNNINNLQYITQKENVRRSARAGRIRGNKKSAKLKPNEAKEIKRRRMLGEKGIDLAKEFGISSQSICDLYKGRTWSETRRGKTDEDHPAALVWNIMSLMWREEAKTNS